LKSHEPSLTRSKLERDRDRCEPEKEHQGLGLGLGFIGPSSSKASSLPTVAVLPTRKEVSKLEVVEDNIPSWRRGGSLRTRVGGRELPTNEQGTKLISFIS
jgi:hypothetical protein